MADEEFHHRTVLVTGGSRGIGRAICTRLAATGARIAINYAANQAAAAETLAEVTAAGGTGALFQADVSDLDQMKQMYGDIEARLGPVDLLVANAGVARAGDNIDMDFDIWNEMMRVNLDGTFYTIWLAKDGMLARGFGRIVCISSAVGLARNPLAPDRLIAYGTSKAAIVGLSRSCASARPRYPSQLHRAWLYRNRDDRKRVRRGPAEAARSDPLGPLRPTRGDRRDGVFSAQRPLELHHRPDHRRLGRIGHRTVEHDRIK